MTNGVFQLCDSFALCSGHAGEQSGVALLLLVQRNLQLNIALQAADNTPASVNNSQQDNLIHSCTSAPEAKVL